MFEMTNQTLLAYIGPGAGLGLVTALVGLLGSVALALGAVVIFPLRSFLKRRNAEAPTNE